MSNKNTPPSRVETAAAGIEDDIINLNERLVTRGDGEAIGDDMRLLEALLFAAVEPIDIETLRERMPDGCDVGALLARLARDYAGRGVNLIRVADRWRFQTAVDLEHDLSIFAKPRANCPRLHSKPWPLSLTTNPSPALKSKIFAACPYQAVL